MTNTIQDSLETHCLWIDQQTPTKLVVKQRLKRWPYVFLVMWSILFAGIPTGLVVLVSSQIGISTLSCQRNESASFDCAWSTRKFLGFGPAGKHQSISQVTAAQLDSAQWSNGQGGGTEKMWVTLSNQSERIRLFETAYAIESGYRPTFQPDAAAEMQRLLASDVNNFAIQEDQRFSVQFLGVLCLAIPFVLLAMAVAYGGLRSRTLILDKITHLYTHQVNTLLGLQVQQHQLSEIQAITTKEFRHHRNGKLRKVYGLEIYLKSNKKHRLPTLRRRASVSKIVVQMQAFIKVL
ncbi:hypothetical protein N836_23035 [Leptolyngbya sp. Heron Island J]|nr:hypothetical protein N836_23035 [Leptolyngbya sp. Heron Island J]